MKNYIGFSDRFINNIKPLGVESNKIDGEWKTLKYTWHSRLVDKNKWDKGTN